MVLATVAGVMAVESGVQLLLSLCSLVTMVAVLTACVCCKKPIKHRREEDLEEAYGVIPADEPRVNFRFGYGHTGERHSPPSDEATAPFGPRSCAPSHPPPRALPPIPAEEDGVSALYAQIDKRAKSTARGETECAGGAGAAPMATYEAIDYDDEIDQLYSKVGPQACRYDYPQFKRETPPKANAGGDGREQEQRPPADPTYQSASQISGSTASEDPYSSIPSGPRVAARPSADGGGEQC